MSDKKLMRLSYEAGARIDDGFARGTSGILVDDLCEDFGRELKTDHLKALLDHAMIEFDYEEKEKKEQESLRSEADAWLAPRVHASLRLTRQEAADRGIWRHLGIVVAPDFVRWRFPGDEKSPTPNVRFVGPDYKHAIGRLWWAAELMRDGTSYANVGGAFRPQDIADNWLRWDMAHNRAVMQGCLIFLQRLGAEKPIAGKPAIRVGQALDRAATTIALDAIAPSPGRDLDAYERWMRENINEQEWFAGEPTGPDDGEVPTEDVDRIIKLLEQVSPIS